MDETMEVRVEGEGEKMGDPGFCFGGGGSAWQQSVGMGPASGNRGVVE